MARYYRYDGLTPENLTHVGCAVCRSEKTSGVGIENGFHIRKCVECGFVYVNPRPNAAQLSRFYADYYDADEVVPEKWEREMKDIFEQCKGWLLARQSAGTVLDIGCSFGHFLRSMEQSGWSVTGIEPSPVAARHAAKLLRGTVLETSLENALLARESFDAIVSLYVLEHVSDPRGFLGKLYTLLKPGGLSIIRIPYTEPLMPVNRLLGRPLMYAPMHLNDFSPSTFRRFGLDLGFREVEVCVGRSRKAHDLMENLGARAFGTVGRLVERLSAGRLVFPFVGAVSYLLHK